MPEMTRRTTTMTLKKSFGLAFSNLMFDKMRSLLTMLGIIIGVAETDWDKSLK